VFLIGAWPPSLRCPPPWRGSSVGRLPGSGAANKEGRESPFRCRELARADLFAALAGAILLPIYEGVSKVAAPSPSRRSETASGQPARFCRRSDPGNGRLELRSLARSPRLVALGAPTWNPKSSEGYLTRTADDTYSVPIGTP
jgi:hypothetical protein